MRGKTSIKIRHEENRIRKMHRREECFENYLHRKHCGMELLTIDLKIQKEKERRHTVMQNITEQKERRAWWRRFLLRMLRWIVPARIRQLA